MVRCMIGNLSAFGGAPTNVVISHSLLSGLRVRIRVRNGEGATSGAAPSRLQSGSFGYEKDGLPFTERVLAQTALERRSFRAFNSRGWLCVWYVGGWYSGWRVGGCGGGSFGNGGCRNGRQGGVRAGLGGLCRHWRDRSSRGKDSREQKVQVRRVHCSVSRGPTRRKLLPRPRNRNVGFVFAAQVGERAEVARKPRKIGEPNAPRSAGCSRTYSAPESRAARSSRVVRRISSFASASSRACFSGTSGSPMWSRFRTVGGPPS
eukprot:133043-Pleurochrysis_carterae.AAC.1